MVATPHAGGRGSACIPWGPAAATRLLWVAFQTGRYVDEGPTDVIRHRHQLAGAALAEVPDVWGQPWLRIGVNRGAGDDYPDYVAPPARAVASGHVDRGVAICGSGVAASVCAKAIHGIRVALIHDHFSARQTS
jgi:hypothetical protein